MRDKIRALVDDIVDDGLYGPKEKEEVVDRFLCIIGDERCVWTRDGDGDWDTECGRCYDHDEVNTPAGYCNGCGKQIEVKDEG